MIINNNNIKKFKFYLNQSYNLNLNCITDFIPENVNIYRNDILLGLVRWMKTNILLQW